MTKEQFRSMRYDQVETFHDLFVSLMDNYETVYGGPRNARAYREYCAFTTSANNAYAVMQEMTYTF